MWLDRAVKWLLPREEHFFDLMEQCAERAVAAALLLKLACEDESAGKREQLINQLAQTEREADRIIHEVYYALNRTFVTPFDKSDIYEVSTELENVTDAICAVGSQLVVHAITEPPVGSINLTANIVEACNELRSGVGFLRKLKNSNEVRARCKRVNELKSEGNAVFRSHIGEMYKSEKDAIRLLKNKEFLEGLDHALDVCDDAANALGTVALKNA